MRRIKLSNGMECKVDDIDYEYLNQWKWKFLRASGCEGGYAVRNGWDAKRKKSVGILMHRLINKTPDGAITDHINRDKLDNRRSNLRTVTATDNMQNRGAQKNSITGVKGVFYDKTRSKYVASLVVGGVEVLRKRFSTLDEAINARKQAEVELCQQRQNERGECCMKE